MLTSSNRTHAKCLKSILTSFSRVACHSPYTYSGLDDLKSVILSIDRAQVNWNAFMSDRTDCFNDSTTTSVKSTKCDHVSQTYAMRDILHASS